ncbi:uncharacterized protein DNG_05933 [Cephalotrichum gorgonifer]|uniref:Zn(2)-C6 fungal-type domain-containing protein n=1 Tax=Cephalotrichum gorgonifer TaxID=2041049 RepID=A0AAE8MYV1_9PEZI|nr:uncharacterized protein DNG_05933 [Cephalotrichum gorgonifer]
MDTPKQQRNRKINTCMECRRLKRKCSRTYPCNHCQQTSRDCVFPPIYPFTPTARSSHSQSPAATASTAGSTASSNHAPLPPVQDSTSAWPDMCLRMGRMSFTERIGGLHRAKALEEMEKILAEAYSRDLDLQPNPEVDQFSGTVAAWFKPHDLLPLGRLFSPPTKASSKDLITLSHEHQRLLIDRFFLAVYPVCPLVTEEDLYDTRPLVVPLRLAVFYAAAASLPLLDSQRLFGSPKLTLVRRLHDAATEALLQADSINCNEVIIFQALLVYLTPQFLGEISRSHSVYISAVIRHFQLAGLDKPAERDPETKRNLKLHLWHHLLFLNIRATEAVGPSGSLLDDTTAELPVMRSPDDIVSIVRYECYRLHRWVFRERDRVAAGNLAVERLAEEGEKRIHDIRTRCLDHLDHRVPLQKYAHLVGTLMLARAKSMISQGALARKPQEVEGWDGNKTVRDMRGEAIGPELDIVEIGILLDTDPDLAPWSWYASAYHQYHSVMIPLIQICQNPDIHNAERFLAAMDHVFGPLSPLSSIQRRATTLLRAISDNMVSFLAMTRSNTPIPSLSDRLELREEDSYGADMMEFGITPEWETLTVAPRAPQYEQLSFDPLLEVLLSGPDGRDSWLYDENAVSQPPFHENGMSQPLYHENSMSETPYGENAISQPPYDEIAVSQPPQA